MVWIRVLNMIRMISHTNCRSLGEAAFLDVHYKLRVDCRWDRCITQSVISFAEALMSLKIPLNPSCLTCHSSPQAILQDFILKQPFHQPKNPFIHATELDTFRMHLTCLCKRHTLGSHTEMAVCNSYHAHAAYGSHQLSFNDQTPLLFLLHSLSCS